MTQGNTVSMTAPEIILAMLADGQNSRAEMQADERIATIFGGDGTPVSGAHVRGLRHRFMSAQHRLVEAKRQLQQDTTDAPELRGIESSRAAWLLGLESSMLKVGANADMASWPADGWANLDEAAVQWLNDFDNYLTSIDNALTEYERALTDYERRTRSAEDPL